MRHVRPLFIATALCITPVAHAQDAAAQAQPAAPAEAPAAAAASSALIPAPQAGKGQVVFFREKKFVGAAMSYKVREGEAELGKLSNGSYLVLEVEPGTHQYHMQGETKDVLTLEVEAGETYYVQGGISMGVLAGRPNLSPSDQAAFEAMAPKLKKR